MDFSNEFINLCSTEEVQSFWIPKKGDYVLGYEGSHIKDTIWIPHKEQLFKMFEKYPDSKLNITKLENEFMVDYNGFSFKEDTIEKALIILLIFLEKKKIWSKESKEWINIVFH